MKLIQLSNPSIANLKLGSLYMISFSVLMRFDYLFGGANRYIPFRIILLVLFFWGAYAVLTNSREVLSNRFTWMYILGFFGFFTLAHFFWMDFLDNSSAFIRNQLHFVYIISGFFITRYLATEIPRDQMQSLLKSVILGLFVVVGTETFLRFFFPTLALSTDSTAYLNKIYEGAQGGLSFDTFYFFKMSSIMFFDSNYVGAFLIVFLSLNIFVQYRSGKWKIISYSIFAILIFLSLSRAAILVGLVMAVYLIWEKIGNVTKWYIALGTVAMSLITLFLIQDQIQVQDGSFLTKLQILEGLNGFFDQDFETALMGLGYEVGGYLYSYRSGGYAHIHIAIILGELGLVGALVYLSFWYVIGVLQGPRVWFVFIPFLIIGFSLADPWEIAYFWACGIINKL